MRRLPRLLLLLAVGTVAVLVSAAGAWANHADRPDTPNMRALGHSLDFGSFLLPDGQRDANSDLAFRGNLVFHGDYDGFRIVARWAEPEGDLADALQRRPGRHRRLEGHARPRLERAQGRGPGL